MLRQQNNEMFNVVVGRSVYEDSDSCTELVVRDSNSPLSLAGQSERSLRVLQPSVDRQMVGGSGDLLRLSQQQEHPRGRLRHVPRQSAQVHRHVHEQLHAVHVLPARWLIEAR